MILAAPCAPAVVSVLRRYPDWSSGKISTPLFLGSVALETGIVLAVQIAGFFVGEGTAMMASPPHALADPGKKPWHALAVGALIRIGITTAGAWGLVRIFFG